LEVDDVTLFFNRIKVYPNKTATPYMSIHKNKRKVTPLPKKKIYAYLQIIVEHVISISAQDYTYNLPYNNQRNENMASETPP
jgi:hypothetical protein